MELGGNIVGDRPTCMMMLKEAEIAVIDYNREQGNKQIQVEKSSLVSLERDLRL